MAKARDYVITMSWNRELDGKYCEEFGACTTFENAIKAAQKRAKKWNGKLADLFIKITKRDENEILWAWNSK